MINQIYKKSFSVLMRRPFRLWGVSLLGALLAYLAGIGFAGILAVGLAVGWALNVSLAMIFLHGYQSGEEPKTADLFLTFQKGKFLRVVGGMAWMYLWIFIWSLIPIAGLVLAVIRAYEYRFVPYILATREEVAPTDALRISKAETLGLKGQMFWADVLPVLAVLAASLVLALFGAIPFVGSLFRLILFLFLVACALFLNLFYGITHAAFYDEARHGGAAAPEAPAAPVPPVIPAPAPQSAPEPEAAPAPEAVPGPAAEPEQESDAESAQPRPKFCPDCGMPVQLDEKFCTACGHKL